MSTLDRATSNRNHFQQRWWWACLLLAMTTTCAGIGAEAERVEAGLIGLKARTLRQCLGDAPFFEIREDGSELWGYAFRTPVEQSDVEISRAVGQGTAFQRPRIESGNPIELGSTQASVALEEREAGLGQCLHVFRIVDGVVQTYTGRGRTSGGLNSSAVCTVELDRCVPPPPTNASPVPAP